MALPPSSVTRPGDPRGDKRFRRWRIRRDDPAADAGGVLSGSGAEDLGLLQRSLGVVGLPHPDRLPGDEPPDVQQPSVGVISLPETLLLVGREAAHHPEGPALPMESPGSGHPAVREAPFGTNHPVAQVVLPKTGSLAFGVAPGDGDLPVIIVLLMESRLRRPRLGLHLAVLSSFV